ncbi:copper resistance D family protein [Kangiella sediminilitoris]|uniref:Copper resistance protein D n=1 Tax=Kangiella sediminilitoris TaxID=1144748 RepID=A0A1B3BAM4_9GAMM|nr:CopD family protein [Kangiella sediminilitoris]AOE49853.1 hypothetical protein KS2013_1133 [Kangiella sediminilitoris]
MNTDLWSLLSAIFKFGTYIGVATILGVVALILIKSNALKESYKSIMIKVVLGIIGTVGYFFTQVGGFAQSGFGGMFDADIIQLLYSTGNGDLLLFRTLGLAYFLFVLMLFHKKIFQLKSSLLAVVLLPSVLCVLWSFTAVGHIADLEWYWQFLLLSHVLVALAWAGSLAPLSRSVETYNKKNSSQMLSHYSKLGIVIVIILFIAGLGLSLKLMILGDNPVATEYIVTFSLKIALVLVMLGLAAYHKFVLSEKLLTDSVKTTDISKSIKKENIIGYGVLLVTALLTTIVGINH